MIQVYLEIQSREKNANGIELSETFEMAEHVARPIKRLLAFSHLYLYKYITANISMEILLSRVR